MLGRDGEVLARSRHLADVQGALHGQLLSMSNDQPADDIQRYELRSLRSDVGVALVGHGLGSHPPFPERGLKNRGLTVVDSPYTDLQRSGLDTTSAEHVRGGPPPPPGHASPRHGSLPVTAIIWHHSEIEPSLAMVTHTLATWARSGTRAQRLSTSAKLATVAPLHFVDGARPSSVLQLAAELLVS